MRIEPALPPANCYEDRCRSQKCWYRCGLGAKYEVCRGARTVCDYVCCYSDEDGFPLCSVAGSTSTECVPA